MTVWYTRNSETWSIKSLNSGEDVVSIGKSVGTYCVHFRSTQSFFILQSGDPEIVWNRWMKRCKIWVSNCPLERRPRFLTVEALGKIYAIGRSYQFQCCIRHPEADAWISFRWMYEAHIFRIKKLRSFFTTFMHASQQVQGLHCTWSTTATTRNSFKSRLRGQ